jgi:hypothetical protein
MLSYLRCIKSHRGTNDPECRNLSKSYLSCRMDRYVHKAFLPSGCALRLTVIYVATPFLPFSVQSRRGRRRQSLHTTRLFRQPSKSVAYTRFCPACPYTFDKRIADHFCAYRNLMAPDSFRNLGFGDDSDGPGSKTSTTTSSQTSQK